MLLKIGHKSEFAQGGCVVRISHQRIGWCEFCCVLAFLPCFPLFSLFKLSYLHVNTKTNSNHIRMNLRAKIKIKTCIYTRKGNKKRMNFLVFEETKFNHEPSVFMLEVDQGG